MTTPNTVLTAEAQSAKEAIEFAGSKGKIFTVTFKKKDGSVREMNARLHVAKYTSGGTRSTAGNPNIMGLYDMKLRKELTEAEGKRAYRSLDLNRVISVNGRGFRLTK
jgi:cystathionine beta-lyase/cystathionine gamma-synthase